jgi:predicted nucleic acid-binding protein
VLIDTDVFVDHLRGVRALAGIARGSYSSITRAELFAGRQDEEILVQGVLAPYQEIPVDRRIAERAGRVRRSTRLDIPDALIAATALEHGLELMTRNARDFARVQGLRLRVPRVT